VLVGAEPIEHEVSSRHGRDYILRLSPLTGRQGVEGVVLTLVDVSDIKRRERELRAARDQTSLDLRRMTRLNVAATRLGGPGDLYEALDEILRAALEITGADMGYIQSCDDANVLAISAAVGFPRPFLDACARIATDVEAASRAAVTTGHRVVIDDVAGSRRLQESASLPALLDAGVRAMQSTPLFDRGGTVLATLSTHYRSVHRFDEAERRWLDLLARPAGDSIHRRQTDAMLTLATDRLEQRLADRTKWLALMHEVTRTINDAANWRQGLRLTVERLCESEGWQAGYVYLPDRADPQTLVPAVGHLRDQRLQSFHRATVQCRFKRGQGWIGLVYDDGRARWLSAKEDVLRKLVFRRDAAEQVGLQAVVTLPVRSGSGVIGVLELVSNERHAPNEMLLDLLSDIGVQIGKVLERERSNTEMADLVWREQQGLLHTLHDSLGQTLTGLGMLATGLARQAPSATVERATQIGELAQQAITQVRQLARGLFPLEIDVQSFIPALRELASTTQTIHGIRVAVEGGDTSLVGDVQVATQLYRIAQEAVTNAVKHASAKSITIAARSSQGVARLQVTDDGIGITGRKSDGMGLRIMMYRAVSIGATLSIEPATPGGTTVTCTLRQPGV
jgi:signal transduction histidine kinase